MDLLTARLATAQERLLCLLGEYYDEHGSWPKWLWLRKALDEGPAGADVLKALPYLGKRFNHLGPVYGLVWLDGGTDVTPYPDMPQVPDTAIVGLTVAGLSRVEHELAQRFITVLGLAVAVSTNFQPSPTDDRWPPFQRSDIAQAEDVLGPVEYDLLAHEPPFWCGGVPNAGSWSFSIDDRIEEYAGATTVEQYFAMVETYLDRAAQVNERIYGISTGARSAPEPTLSGGLAAVTIYPEAIAKFMGQMQEEFDKHPIRVPVTADSSAAPHLSSTTIINGPVIHGNVDGATITGGTQNVRVDQGPRQIAPGFELIATAVAKTLEGLPAIGLDDADLADAEEVANEVLVEVTQPDPDRSRIRRAVAALKGYLAPLATGVANGAAAGVTDEAHKWVKTAIEQLGTAL